VAGVPAVTVTAVEPDGRRRRTLRTREAIVHALIALVDGGNPAPTAAQVAARAGVALRSIGQHFASREALFLAAAGVHARRADAERLEVDADAPRETRVRRFAAGRAAALEASAPLRRAVLLLEPRPRAVEDAARAQADRRRAEVARVFAAELAARSGTARRRLLDRLDLLASGRTWDGLRQDLGLSATAAAAELGELLLATSRRASD
jgi:AcrR family transcriptional regulator